jgi:DNA-3-methyladenine glycosylase I
MTGRCFGDGDPLYEAYHDTEWGVPVRGDQQLYERFCLEAFQSGLAWITILRKRPAFRTAFDGFDPELVARYGGADVERLLTDAGIVRNRAKIVATIANARAVLDLAEAGGSLTELVWSHAPDVRVRDARATTLSQVPAVTAESAALARELKRVGFRFVGPTTAYAAMQACGLVDDHLAGCPVVTGASVRGATASGPVG